MDFDILPHFDSKGAKFFPCLFPLCKIKFSTKNSFTNHMKTHVVLFQICQQIPTCSFDLCGSKFCSEFHLNLHQNYFHSQVERLFCYQCGKQFYNKSNLYEHEEECSV